MLTLLTAFICFSALIGFHEWGHYVVAKRQGIYKFMGICPFGICVQMSSILNSRWDYLAGIASSFIAFPFFLVLIPTFREWWWLFPLFALAIGIVDIACFALYNQIAQNFKESQLMGEPVQDISIPISSLWGRK